MAEGSARWKVVCGICAVLVGASGFYLKSCTGAQNDSLAASKRHWGDVRETTQTYYDRQEAFNSAVMGFFDDIKARSRNAKTLEGDKQNLIGIVGKLHDSCEEVKKARYDFMNDWSNLETAFLLRHTTFSNISDQCKGWLPLAQELSQVDSEDLCTDQKYRDDFLGTKSQIIDFKKYLDNNRKAEQEAATGYDADFRSISNRGIFLNCWTCVKRSIKR
jgi:hypothetical protein